MAASSKGLAAPPFHLRIGRSCLEQPLLPAGSFRGHSLSAAAAAAAAARRVVGVRTCCCPGEKAEQWRPEPKKNGCRGGGSVARRNPAEDMSLPLRSVRSKRLPKQLDFSSRCSTQNSAPESRDTPPKRDTGIASEKEWGINLLDEKVDESGTNEDGSTWYRESGEVLGDNGYRHRWALMGGQSRDGSSKWKETWWEKSDWTGYKELGAEKSGENAEGDSWWETWKEVLYQDEWSNLARIERSAKKQAKSDAENAEWYEHWWEKYDAKGSTKKGAHKYGSLNEQSWCEKWGEYYDGRGFVHKWTDKWAEKLGLKWGDKWEEKFYGGMGSRQGETWRVSPPNNERWTRTWGEQHHGHGKVHKYGHSTTGESWDTEVDEETHYQTEPHYGWADVVGDSTQLLSIKPRPRPPGVFPDFNAPRPRDGPPKS